MATYRWPGSTGTHTISWQQHQSNVAAKRALAAPGSPAATAPDVAPAEAVLPPDPGYENQRAGYEKTRDTAQSGSVQERTRGLAEYGFTETGYDPAAGKAGALAFDPNNPFSKAALLKKNYDVSRARTGGQMASTGGLYSGAYQTAQDSLNRGQLGDEDALQKSLGQFLSGNQGQYAQAGIDYGINVGGINQADRALTNPLYTPTAPAAPVAAAPVGPVAPKAPVVKPTGGVGKPAVKRQRPANVAVGRGTTNKPRVRTITRSVHTP